MQGAEIFPSDKAQVLRPPVAYITYVTKGAKAATQADGKRSSTGAIAQLGERLPCTQEVGGSIPPGSTNLPGSPEASSSRAQACYAETFDRPKIGDSWEAK